jgi:hypothetical protein
VSEVKLEFAPRSKAFSGTPLAELLRDAACQPLGKSRDKSDAVVALQTALTQLGYDCGIADGKFGPGTAEVVRNFQKDVVSKVDPKPLGAGPAADGSADWLTLLALDAACAALEGGLQPAPQPKAKEQPKDPPKEQPKDPNSGGGGQAPEAPKTEPKSAVRAGYDLLPEDLKKRYLQMSFALDGEQVNISLEHLIYQNLGLKPPKKSNFNLPCKDHIVGLVGMLQKREAAWLDENIGPKLAKGVPEFVMHAMGGKGSPEQIQAVLRIAGHCRKDMGSHWTEQGSLSASLQELYRSNMGLDCSGFAGNYARAVGHRSFGPNTGIVSFAPPNMRRHKLDEILPGDLIVWTNNSHIATIQGRRSDGVFDIVESSGETDVQGLGDSVRSLAEAGGDEFRVRKIHPDGRASPNPEPVWVSTIFK